MRYRNVIVAFFLLALFGCKEEFYVNPNAKDLLPPHVGPGPGTDPVTQNPKREVPYLVTESFTGNNQQKLDLLMVIDNSGSMTEEIQSVKEQLGAFTERLQSRRAVDYQMAYTTTNFVLQTRPGNEKLQASTQSSTNGRRVVMSATDSDPVGIARDIIQSIPVHRDWSPVYYSGWEMGILAAKDTIETTGSVFMRDRTDLAVITVSDEDDHSDIRCLNPNDSDCRANAGMDYVCSPDGGTCPYMDLGQAKSFFQGLGRSVLYRPLVGLPTASCTTVFSVGNRYIGLAQLLGFEAMNVCTDTNPTALGLNLLSIADSISARGICFPLTQKATGNAIEVSISTGLAVPQIVPEGPDGYRFDAATNAICFPGSVIFDGSSSVVVSYQSLRLE